VKFVIDTKSFGFKVEPKVNNDVNWNLHFVYDWAGDPETRVSITGFVIYLLDVPICWCSKAQKSVLSPVLFLSIF